MTKTRETMLTCMHPQLHKLTSLREQQSVGKSGKSWLSVLNIDLFRLLVISVAHMRLIFNLPYSYNHDNEQKIGSLRNTLRKRIAGVIGHTLLRNPNRLSRVFAPTFIFTSRVSEFPVFHISQYLMLETFQCIPIMVSYCFNLNLYDYNRQKVPSHSFNSLLLKIQSSPL